MYAESNYGIGITGKLNRVDKCNLYGSDNTVYISVYDRDNDVFFNKSIDVNKSSRLDNKVEIGHIVIDMMLEIL